MEGLGLHRVRKQGKKTTGMFFNVWAAVDWLVIILTVTDLVVKILSYYEDKSVAGKIWDHQEGRQLFYNAKRSFRLHEIRNPLKIATVRIRF